MDLQLLGHPSLEQTNSDAEGQSYIEKPCYWRGDPSICTTGAKIAFTEYVDECHLPQTEGMKMKREKKIVAEEVHKCGLASGVSNSNRIKLSKRLQETPEERR